MEDEKRLVQARIDKELHKEFKGICVKLETSIQDILISWIEKFVENRNKGIEGGEKCE